LSGFGLSFSIVAVSPFLPYQSQLALQIFVSMLPPPEFAHARQARAPALALGRGECFLLPAAEAA
jgi:hypothetical protein